MPSSSRPVVLIATVIVALVALTTGALTLLAPSDDADESTPAPSSEAAAPRSATRGRRVTQGRAPRGRSNTEVPRGATESAPGRSAETSASARSDAPPAPADSSVGEDAGGEAPAAETQGVRAGQNRFGERSPQKLREIAEEMRVGETVIVAALDAEHLLRQTNTERTDASAGMTSEEALSNLAGYGVEGYRAVLAMLRTGYQGTWFITLVKRTYQAGYENELISVASDDEVAEFSRWSALESLQFADTPAVREFLRNYLAAHPDDAGLFMSAAAALGELHDADAAVHLRDKLQKDGWDGVRSSLINSLAGMGGDVAREILVEFIRDPSTDDVRSAFQALVTVDAAAAKDELARFLETTRGEALSEVDRARIEEAIEAR